MRFVNHRLKRQWKAAPVHCVPMVFVFISLFMGMNRLRVRHTLIVGVLLHLPFMVYFTLFRFEWQTDGMISFTHKINELRNTPL